MTNTFSIIVNKMDSASIHKPAIAREEIMVLAQGSGSIGVGAFKQRRKMLSTLLIDLPDLESDILR